MYIGWGPLSIINTEGQMRIFLMTTVEGVVGTTCGRGERVKHAILSPPPAQSSHLPSPMEIQCKFSVIAEAQQDNEEHR